MGDRVTVHFQQGGRTDAIVYSHYGVDGDTLNEFFNEIETNLSDTRFNDPPYLAAKFVVWLALKSGSGKHPLDFLGVGVYQFDPEDLSRRYLVDCRTPRPTFKEKTSSRRN